MRRSIRSGLTRMAAPGVALLLALPLAGCGGDPSNTLGNLLAFNSPTAPPAPVAADPNAKVLRSCPEVEVKDGGGSLRVGGPSSESVRHQFSMSDVARECQIGGGQLTIKVGIEGNVVIGPAGGAGTYSAPITVSVRRESDQSIVTSRSYQVSASVPAGAGQGPFTLIAEPVSVPFVNEYAADDYAVVVAFGSGGGRSVKQARRRR